MPPDLVTATPARTAIERHWRDALIRLGGVWLALVLAFLGDWQAMLGQWWNSSTYNHILLIPAIIGWLIWMRVAELRKLTPRAWPPGLAAMAGAVLVWLLGAFAGFDLLRQIGAVATLPAAVLLLLGPRLAMGMLFPLFYMVFLVPFGDELVPTLQMITAALTITLVKLSGVPAVIDGVFIDTPAGLFEVAEACSGVKFLIAMIALGVLVANICFRSWRRRVAFLALCVVAPVLANGLRAWGTVYVAQYVGAEKAGGFDHIVYGWVFFALVIAAVLALAWRFFDRAVDDPMIDAAALTSAGWLTRLERFRMAEPLAIVLCGLLVLGGHGWARAANSLAAMLPLQIFLPEVPGWQRVDYAPTVWWEPRAGGADHRLLGRYVDNQGRHVDVFYALYAAQDEGREASGFGEGALPPDSEWAWASGGPAVPDAKADILRARGTIERMTLTYYRSGELLTGSALSLKLALIGDRLLLRQKPTAMLILSTEQNSRREAAETLASFRRSTGPVGAWMDRIAAVR